MCVQGNFVEATYEFQLEISTNRLYFFLDFNNLPFIIRLRLGLLSKKVFHCTSHRKSMFHVKYCYL